MNENENRATRRRRATRREFGSVRPTAAGRFQARYTAPDGTARKGPHTFATRRDAEDFLADVRSQLRHRNWNDPDRWCPTVSDYFATFQEARIGRGGGSIRSSTRALADDQFRRYIDPAFGTQRLDSIRSSDVNRWYASLPDKPALRRQLYALMKALFQSAIRDEIVERRNPCQIPRAGQNPPSKRPAFRYEEVLSVIDLLPNEFKVLAHVAYGAHLRLGEALSLRWASVDLASGVVEVSRSVTEVNNAQVETATKTERVRQVKLTQVARTHLRAYAIGNRRDPDDRVFFRADGSALRHFHVHRVWNEARLRAGVPSLRFHDLRHVSLTMLAEGGASLRSLMYRAGHTTVDAALVYQHRAADRNDAEADAMDRQIELHVRAATT